MRAQTHTMTAAATSETDRLVGGRYRLRRQLGRGGSGVVWVAEDELLGRQVAVKEFLLPFGVDAEDRQTMLARVLHEARAAARLHDPSLVTVFDVVREDEQPWIVMEYVHGRSLAQVLREDGPLSPQRAAEIGVVLLHALRTAHASGVLHRDVKPANVMLDDAGRVLLTDFGIATTSGDPSLTMMGVLLGSPAYMSPERARGERATPASDLWSLGATLYTLVEGEPPYTGENSLAVLSAVADNRRRPTGQAGALGPVLADLLDAPAGERPDADELARRLRECARQPDLAPEQPLTTPLATSRPERVGERTTMLSPGAAAGGAGAAAAGAADAGKAADRAGEATASDVGSAADASPAPPVKRHEATPAATAPSAPPTGKVGAAPHRVEPCRVPPRSAGSAQTDERRRRRAAGLLGAGAAVAVLAVGGVAYLASTSSSGKHASSFAAATASPTGTGIAPSTAPSSPAASASPSASASAAPPAPSASPTVTHPRADHLVGAVCTYEGCDPTRARRLGGISSLQPAAGQRTAAAPISAPPFSAPSRLSAQSSASPATGPTAAARQPRTAVSTAPATPTPSPPVMPTTPPVVMPTPPVMPTTPPVVMPTPPVVMPTPPVMPTTPPVVMPTPPVMPTTPPVVMPTPPALS